MRNGCDQRNRVLEKCAPERDQHAWTVAVASFLVAVRYRIMRIQPCAPVGTAAPVGQGLTQFLSLVGKNLKLDLSAGHLHVTANALKKHFRGGRTAVVPIGEVLVAGENGLCLQQSGPSNYLLQASEAAIDPETLFLIDG